MRSWNGSIERLNFCGFLLSTQEGVFPNDREALKQRLFFAKRRSNIADKEKCQVNSIFNFSPPSFPCCHKIPREMKNGFGLQLVLFVDHPNQKLAHFIFSPMLVL